MSEFCWGFPSHKNKTATKFDHNVLAKKTSLEKKTQISKYCWWTKSCTTKDDDYAIMCRVLTIPGAAGFRPSTVSPQNKIRPKSHDNVTFWSFWLNSEAKIAFPRPCTCWVFVEVVCLKKKSPRTPPRNGKTKNKQKHPKVGKFFGRWQKFYSLYKFVS